MRDCTQASTALESHATARPAKGNAGGNLPSAINLYKLDRGSPVLACTCWQRSRARIGASLFASSTVITEIPWTVVERAQCVMRLGSPSWSRGAIRPRGELVHSSLEALSTLHGLVPLTPHLPSRAPGGSCIAASSQRALRCTSVTPVACVWKMSPKSLRSQPKRQCR